MLLFQKGLINFLLVASFLLIQIATSANDNNSSENSYNPPAAKRIKQKRTVGSGSRGLCKSPFPKGALTLLVPESKVVHYTTLSRPSFYLYANATSEVPLIFNIIIPNAPTVDNPITEKTVTISQPGIYKIELPTGIELETEQIYFWQIGIPCKDNLEQIDQVLKAAVQKVPVSAELANQIEDPNLFEKKAQQLAALGIWYDALNLAVTEAFSSKGTNYLQELVREIGVDLQNSYLLSSKL